MSTEKTKSNSVTPISDPHPNLDEEIRRRAYELYKTGGCEDGHDLEDWVSAEAEITGTAVKPRQRKHGPLVYTMKKAFHLHPDFGDWKTLYRAAILEKNKNVIPQKVSEAEQAVLARGRQLIYSGGTDEEKEFLEDALYALRAFRTAWEHTQSEIAVAEAAAA